MKPWLILVAAAGCIRAPAVVITDRRTAVEQQASGSFRGLEEELEQAGLVPRPAPLTASQLGASGVRAADEQQESDGSDALRADALLVKRCAGEALDGTIVLTLDPCTGAIDVPQVTRLLERINRERRQLWRWLAGQAPGKTPEQILAAWRGVHLAGLVCGGQVQAAGGGWEIKTC